MRQKKLPREEDCWLNRRREIAENILGGVEWQSEAVGLCLCPGADSHSSPTREKDSRVTVDGTPTLFCFHQSCTEAVSTANRELRDAIHQDEVLAMFGGSPKGPTRRRVPRDRERRTSHAGEQALYDARAALPEIVRKFQWSMSDAINESPIEIPASPVAQTKLFLRKMFNPDNIVWTGEVYHSGEPEHARQFRTVADWLRCERIHGPFTCASTFRHGVYHRRTENIISRPYIVLEGDLVDAGCASKHTSSLPFDADDKKRNRMACLAVLNWLRSNTDLVLRAVVDAANKSIHGWFDMPDEATLTELKVILPGLGFDTAVLRATQPVRLAGAYREGAKAWQKLIYLHPPTLEDRHAKRF